ncbi:MAG: CoA ester lyase [Bacillota bacterium]
MYRSYLFSPASDTRKMEKGLASGADAVIFDLEDGVAPSQKDAARANLVEFLESIDWSKPHPAVFVRVNGAMTPWFHRDLEAVYHPQVAGYMIPKVESRETLVTAEAALVRAAGSEDAAFQLIPFVESAHALWNLPAIVQGQRRVPRVILGGEDFATELGIRAVPGGLSYVVPRGLLALLSRVAGLEPPVDTVYAAFRDEAGLRAELQQAKELGCFGKLAIHPAQIEPINEAFTPSDDDIAWARRVLEAFDASLAAGRGAGKADGAMVEKPIAERARRILALAEAVAQRQARHGPGGAKEGNGT